MAYKRVPTVLVDPNTKKTYLNPLKKAVRSYFLTMRGGQLAIPANGFAQQTFPTNMDSAFVGYKISGAFTSNLVLVTIRNVGTGLNLMNRPIHAQNMIGTNVNPHAMATGLALQPTQALEITLQDLSGVANTADLVIEGKNIYWQKFGTSILRETVDKYVRDEDRRPSTPYYLTTDTAVRHTVLNTPIQTPMTIPPLGDFKCWKIMAFSDAAFDWRISDGFQGEYWHNTIGAQFIPSTVAPGTAAFPYELHEPVLVAKNNILTLETQATALVGGQNRIWFTLGGKLFPEDPRLVG